MIQIVNRKRVFNTIFFAIAAYALYMRMPIILTSFKFQNKIAPDFTVRTLSQSNFTLSANAKKTVIVFWATWCGPCELELKRINKMIEDKKISANDVLAISTGEEESLVRETVKKKNYLFNVGLDSDGHIAKLYEVTVTPTIIFIDQKQTVDWMTIGISPTLEFRISSFFK